MLVDSEQESDIIDMLKPKEDEEQAIVQSREISDADLELLLDRSDLVASSKNLPPVASKLPSKGPGWEVVVASGGKGMLSSIT